MLMSSGMLSISVSEIYFLQIPSGLKTVTSFIILIQMEAILKIPLWKLKPGKWC